MRPEIQEYIRRININDPTLLEINLANLDLSDADIAPLMEALHLHSNVAQRITSLDLRSNQLRIIPNFSHLVALEGLYLSENQLTVAPDLSMLVELYELSLADNQLTVAPNLSGLVKLRRLSLSNNQITDIPNLSGLTFSFLGIINNPLTFAAKIALENFIRIQGGGNIVYDKLLITPEQKRAGETILKAYRKYCDKKKSFYNLAIDSTFTFQEKEYRTTCPISLEVMRNPQILTTHDNQQEYKHIVDESSIKQWFKISKTNPFNKIACDETNLSDFHELKAFITQECELKARLIIGSKINNNRTYCGFESGFINKRGKLGLFS